MMSSHIVTPGPYRATKLWNEVTKLFRAGMPLRKHRQHFRVYGNCFTAVAAVDWLHELLRNNSNFGPDVTRQQTVQLLKKFLKNHVIEDVKGRWGSEDMEENSHLYRFASTSPLKPIPHRPPVSGPASVKKNFSMKEKDGFFKFRTSKKPDKETIENVDPSKQDMETEPVIEVVQPRELTEEDIQDVWRGITLTHLQKTLGLTALEDVLDPRHINPQNIVYNMTNVNKHGVVTLEDKTDDLPHWVLSAMKCLANWPKYDSSQPSYPGFERDVFKTVSDYFYSLPQPLLTFEYYELFVNILVLCGYIVAPKTQRGKRKNQEEPSYPQSAKNPHMNGAVNQFKSTECLLLSLIRKEAFEEGDSPMREVFSSKAQSTFAALKTGCARRVPQMGLPGRRASSGDVLGGSSPSLACSESSGASSVRLRRPRSCSLERILDESAESDSCSQHKLFQSTESLASCKSNSGSKYITPPQNKTDSLSALDSCPYSEPQVFVTMATPSCDTSSGVTSVEGSTHSSKSEGARSSISLPMDNLSVSQKPMPKRRRSIGTCLDIAEHRGKFASCFSINAPVAEITVKPDSSSTVGLRGPSLLNLRASSIDLRDLRARPSVSRRCQSSLDLSRPTLALPSVFTNARHLSSEQSLLQPQLERVAIEALQLCTLLLPPASRRKLQLLMRMISRMSQNVDMPRLHDVIGTRTLMVHTFSRCVLGCEEEMDLDELLATRLVSFLMDHHQEILQVPVYLQNAVQDHVAYLRKVQITYPGSGGVGAPMPIYYFCRQISTKEFEEQKLSVSQAAIADLLESLVKDKNMSVKDKKKKLKQFQRQYTDIYARRFPTTESEAQLFEDKPKIKPPMLISMKKPKAFGIRN
ncbi:DEP domain-containing protein 1A isoform X1 [Coregonus clupeaformis]|uniref:DEP domain-containing protein 1A isoform X1 n=1 Tax=Coregonus clupeaformis TaxID=59861 RepID=UPI001BDFB2DB|nr:DEP domain-containing protein 1A isoform X1 [Coregonus clupeaformis]